MSIVQQKGSWLHDSIVLQCTFICGYSVQGAAHKEVLDRFTPQNGTVISTFEGRRITIMCELFSGSIQTTTIWSVLYFNGSDELQSITNESAPNQLLPSKEEELIYHDKLALFNVSSNLDRATVFCGTSSEPEVAMFPLRVHGRSSCACRCLQYWFIYCLP